MGLHYDSLSEAVRAQMVSEVMRDIARGALYQSARLSPRGQEAWPELLLQACGSQSDDWLADQVRDLLNEMERRGRGMARVPHTAPITLAEGEFNRFYARAVCLEAIAAGETGVEVYRGKAVGTPRSRSQAMIGRVLDPRALLDDLRQNVGVETALGLPPGPNSGLTIRRLG